MSFLTTTFLAVGCHVESNWRNQAIAQACAVCSPFCGSMSAVGILQQTTFRASRKRVDGVQAGSVTPATGFGSSGCTRTTTRAFSSISIHTRSPMIIAILTGCTFQ